MERLGEVCRRLMFLFRRNRFQRELQEEMQFHLEMKARALRDAGVAPDEASSAARRHFGNTLLLREASRQSWGWNTLETVCQDLRYGLRQLRRSPGFTLVALLTLALGIGANTAVFTLVDAVMLKSLPVTDPQQLYSLGADDNCCEMTGLQGNFTIYSYALYKELQEHTPQFTQLAAFQAGAMPLAVRRSQGRELAQPYRGEFISGNYFQMFGISAYAGRLLAPADDHSGAPPVAVMSYRVWQQRYGGDPTLIDSTVVINSKVFTLAGITPPGFFGDRLTGDPPDFWLPLFQLPAGHRTAGRPGAGGDWFNPRCANCAGWRTRSLQPVVRSEGLRPGGAGGRRGHPWPLRRSSGTAARAARRLHRSHASPACGVASWLSKLRRESISESNGERTNYQRLTPAFLSVTHELAALLQVHIPNAAFRGQSLYAHLRS